MTESTSLTLRAQALALAAHPDYRVLQRFVDTFPRLTGPLPEGARIALALDTETTGKDRSDVVVEVGIVAFAYNPETGDVLGIVDTYSGLEDPGAPMSPEVIKVHGITDDMVIGQEFDDAKIEALRQMATFVVAHNSSFDRPMMEARFPLFAQIPWACSMSQIPWPEAGMETRKLKVIAMELGHFYEAHRAMEDALAMLQVLTIPLTALGSRTGLAVLLDTYASPTFRLWARNSPFHTKDILKSRGYRWSAGDTPGQEKAWYQDLPTEAALTEELAWLREHVYRGAFSVPVTANEALTQFSERSGSKSMHYLD